MSLFIDPGSYFNIILISPTPEFWEVIGWIAQGLKASGSVARTAGTMALALCAPGGKSNLGEAN